MGCYDTTLNDILSCADIAAFNSTLRSSVMPPVSKVSGNTISLDNSNHGVTTTTPVSLSNGFKVESILKTEADLAVQTIVETRKTGATPTPTETTPQDVTPSKSSSKKLKEPSLNLSFPAKAGGLELKLLVQPEDQHRARYMTEGSRGAVKDKSQQAHPVIQVNILYLGNSWVSHSML